MAMDGLRLSGAFPTGLTPKSEVVAIIRALQLRSVPVAMLRLGPDGDGGYLVPNDLAGIGACFSPGVADISGFEEACADLGLQVFLADKSVDGPSAPHPQFRFTKK